MRQPDPGRRSSGLRDALHQVQVARPRAPDRPVQPLGLGHDFEPALQAADRFGTAKQQDAALVEREMKLGDHLGLRLGPEIDQQVAA